MLSTANCINVETHNYSFNDSPVSSGEDSFISDYFDSSSPSDEDFLQQLSADLDIPLLLNPGEDEMSLLNSFLDRSPGEILSEISVPVKIEPTFYHSDFSEVKIEDSDSAQSMLELKCSLISQGEPFKFNGDGGRPSEIKVQKVNIIPPLEKSKDLCLKVSKGPPKRAGHSPPYVIPSFKTKSIVPIPTGVANILPRSIISNCSTNVVVLDNISTIPSTINVTPVFNATTTSTPTVSYISPQSPNIVPKVENIPVNFVSLNCGQSFDTKALKRQQRMIKNRESACLSRKRKRDYVTSLENIVQQLTDENERLKVENKHLRDQLCNNITNPLFSLPSKTVTKALTVCAVFCVMGLNLNYLQSPLNSRTSLTKLNADKLLTRDHHGRNLLWAQDFPTLDSTDTYNSPNKSNGDVNTLPVCPVQFNQSENVRLVLDLHRLIGKPYNITEDLFENIQFDHNKSKPKKSKVGRFRHRNIPVVPSSLYKINKRNKKVAYTALANNELQVFSPYRHPSYPEFFEAINRQDDTFYLVSLSSDHLLLPALNHNKTSRPKMSLLVPSIVQNLSSSQTSTISLMQIDCEVWDTRLIHVKYGSIPQHLRTHNNSTQPTHEDKVHHEDNSQDPSDNSYKPYFLHKTHSQFKNATNDYSIIN